MQEALAKIRDLITNAKKLSDSQKAEMLRYVKSLDHELTALAREKEDEAKNIAHLTHIRTKQALADDVADEEAELHEGFSAAVEKFELSHPRLYKALQTISISLSGLGV